MELAIVVARRSWFEIYLRKLENTGRKKRSIQERREMASEQPELNRRDQVTAAKSWPSSLRKEGNRGRLSGSSTY